VSGAARPSTDAVVRNDRAEPLGSVALADLLDVLHRVGAGQAVAEGLSGQCGAAAALEAAIVRALIDPALPLPVFLACARAFRTTHAAPDASVRVLTGEIEEWLFAAIAVAVPADPRVATALSVIERAIADRLRPTEQQIADAVHVDRAHLGRLIRDETGLSFRQWRTGLFLRFSVGHLLGTSERVGQIAWHVLGYEHVSQFDREFRELFGLSPREFRERAQQIGPSHRPVLVATMRRDDRNDVS
jgi:AraC-like DNA-binding protein